MAEFTVGNKLIVSGEPAIVTDKAVEANVPPVAMLPGMLAMKGTTDGQIMVADGVTGPAVGWVTHEHTDIRWRKDSLATPYDVGDVVGLARGGPFVIRAILAPAQVVVKGDALVAGPAGMLQKATPITAITDAGAIQVTSTAAQAPVTITGDYVGTVVAYAEESLTTVAVPLEIQVKNNI
jgi:hypothetical protein